MAKHLEAASVLPACPASLAGSPLKNRLLTPSKQSSKLNFLCIPRLPEADNMDRAHVMGVMINGWSYNSLQQPWFKHLIQL